MTNDEIFNELFQMTISAQAARVQLAPPVVTASATKPTGPQTIEYAAKNVGAAIGTTFAVFKKADDLKDLKEGIAWIYENRNTPFTQLATTLDLKANIQSKSRGSATTWRDFVEGLYRDKVIGSGDFTNVQLNNIVRLYTKLGLPAIKFKKVV